jgi:hypothetical protein
MQKWHSARDTVFREKARTMLIEEPLKDGCSGKNVDRNQKASRE